MSSVIQDGEILLYDYRLPIVGPIREELVSVFPGKVVIGDPTLADDPVLSSYVMTDWTGGILKNKMEPSVDFDRAYWSTCATWFSKQLTLGSKVRNLGNAGFVNTHVRTGSEYDGKQHVVFDDELVRVEDDEDLTALGPLGGLASCSQVYRVMTDADAGSSWYFIGTADGFSVWDGATITNVTEEPVVGLTVWDDKLVKVDRKGVLKYSTDGAAWTAVPGQNVVPLPYDSVTGLLVFPDAAGDDSLHIPTIEGLYFYDEAGQRVRRTRLNLPRLGDAGRASTAHQDNLYFAGGSLELLRYTGSTVGSEGLDRDDGLPADRRGRVAAVASFLNGLVCIVDASEPSPLGDPIFAGNETGMTMTMYEARGFATVFAQFNGAWHVLYSSGDMGSGAKWAGTSAPGDKYRLWFGMDGQLFTMDLYRDIHNVLENTLAEFRETDEHITPWNNMSLAKLSKLALGQDFRAKFTNDCELCRIEVFYGLDREDAWYPLGTITEASSPLIQFGGGLGIEFRDIRFKFQLYRCTDETHTPVLWDSTFEFIKPLEPRFGYKLEVVTEKAHGGLEPEEIAQALRSIAGEAQLGVFKGWVDGTYVTRNVRLTMLAGSVGGGTQQKGRYWLSLIAL